MITWIEGLWFRKIKHPGRDVTISANNMFLKKELGNIATSSLGKNLEAIKIWSKYFQQTLDRTRGHHSNILIETLRKTSRNRI